MLKKQDPDQDEQRKSLYLLFKRLYQDQLTEDVIEGATNFFNENLSEFKNQRAKFYKLRDNEKSMHEGMTSGMGVYTILNWAVKSLFNPDWLKGQLINLPGLWCFGFLGSWLWPKLENNRDNHDTFYMSRKEFDNVLLQKGMSAAEVHIRGKNLAVKEDIKKLCQLKYPERFLDMAFYTMMFCFFPETWFFRIGLILLNRLIYPKAKEHVLMPIIEKCFVTDTEVDFSRDDATYYDVIGGAYMLVDQYKSGRIAYEKAIELLLRDYRNEYDQIKRELIKKRAEKLIDRIIQGCEIENEETKYVCWWIWGLPNDMKKVGQDMNALRIKFASPDEKPQANLYK